MTSVVETLATNVATHSMATGMFFEAPTVISVQLFQELDSLVRFHRIETIVYPQLLLLRNSSETWLGIKYFFLVLYYPSGNHCKSCKTIYII